MTFLSKESLESRLNELIIDKNGEPAGKLEQIDCNSYELKIGDVRITTDEDGKKTKSISFKTEGEKVINIPSGQFGLILTKEFISIPQDLMGFISIKSTYKMKGLVSVSGFHVDPGWKGRLAFTIYNAGPHDIPLIKYDRMFLIWFAKLDKKVTTGKKDIDIKKMKKKFSSTEIFNMEGEVYSPQVLAKRVERYELFTWKKFSIWLFSVFISLFIGVFFGITSDWISYLMKDSVGYEEELSEKRYSKINEELKELHQKIDDLIKKLSSRSR